MPRSPFEQCRKPRHTRSTTDPHATTGRAAQGARLGLGIRRLGGGLADAQGFFAQFGTSRRAPVATVCGGNAPQSP